MPSYIELDKTSNIPSSSDASKIVLGINTSGQVVTVNNSGITSPVGGGSSYTPNANDFIFVGSYQTLFHGNKSFGPAPAVNKFDAIEASGGPSDYLNFRFIGGKVNGRVIPKSQTSQSVQVDYLNLTYRDDGAGLAPANYVDFVNSIFTSQSIYTRFTASSVTGDGNYGIVSNYCTSDDFTFTFLETGYLLGAPIQPILYIFGTCEGLGIADKFSAPLNSNTPDGSEISNLLNQFASTRSPIWSTSSMFLP